jgi:lysophospholipase L1-like esterase
MNVLSARALLAGLAALWAFWASGCDAEGLPNPATRPAFRAGEREWLARHEELLARSRQGGARVVFLGDSITHFWEILGVEAWAGLRHLRPGNFGIGGDQTGHLLWRITAGGELDGLDPTTAVLLIGTNNLYHGHPPEQVAAGIAAVVGELRCRKPHMKVLVLGIFPREAAPGDPMRDRVRWTNEIVRRLADGKDVFYRDIGDRFLAADGTLSREIMPDHLHLGPAGYAIWADAIRGDLEELTAKTRAAR